MELKNLESFIQAAELGSFTRAAKKLGYTQSTISFQIKQLEEELKVQLFERVNHTVKLTRTGSELLKLAHQIMKNASEMKKTAGNRQSLHGCIRIAIAASLSSWLFQTHFEPFHRAYPYLTLKVISGSTEEMFRLLNQNEVDLVYTLDKHLYNRNYVIACEEPVGVHFVAAPSHPLNLMKERTIEQILDVPSILTEKNMSYRTLLEEHLASKSMAIDPFLEIGDTTLICQLVERGLGISFLPDFVTEEAVARGSLVRLEMPDIHLQIWKQLLYHRDKWVSSEMESVIEHLIRC